MIAWMSLEVWVSELPQDERPTVYVTLRPLADEMSECRVDGEKRWLRSVLQRTAVVEDEVGERSLVSRWLVLIDPETIQLAPEGHNAPWRGRRRYAKKKAS